MNYGEAGGGGFWSFIAIFLLKIWFDWADENAIITLKAKENTHVVYNLKSFKIKFSSFLTNFRATEGKKIK